ncbi:hypothetical protein Hanom_Chr11g01038201 [Helianthus anomalus]
MSRGVSPALLTALTLMSSNDSRHFTIWQLQVNNNFFYILMLYILLRVKYTGGPCGLLIFRIWSLAFQKYTDGPCGLHFVTHLVPSQHI